MKRIWTGVFLIFCFSVQADQMALIRKFEECKTGNRKLTNNISDDMLKILYLQKQIKEAQLEERRQKYYKALGPKKDDYMRYICNKITIADPSYVKKTIARIRGRLKDPFLDGMSYGEILFFTDCGGWNAVFHAFHPDYFDYTGNEILGTPKFVIKSVASFIREKGDSQYNLIEFLQRRIDEAHRAGAYYLEGGYKRALYYALVQIGER